MTLLHKICWALILFSLLPALFLVNRRIRAEGSRQVVTFIMDEEALALQADFYGLTSFDLAERYRTLGLTGVALYEETLQSLAAKGDIILAEASELRLSYPDEDAPLPPADMFVSEVTPGALGDAVAKVAPAPPELEFGNRTWYAFTGADEERPAGYRSNEVTRWAAAGYDIGIRPRDYVNIQNVGADYPDEANYLIYAGLEVSGLPNSLDAVIDVSQNYLTGIIEGTEQAGMTDISRRVPTVRLLSFNQDYIDERLSPESLVEKYLLAAEERGVRILYLRPYLTDKQGDPLENTSEMLRGLTAAFTASGYTVAPLENLDLDYQTSPFLRGLTSLGALGALALLALSYPGVWGLAVSGAVAGLAFLLCGFDWATFALIAALSFPVIGYAYFSERLTSLGVATLLSLAGALVLSGVGSDREAMLALTPFRGVGATLVIPPALFVFQYALRYRRPAAWVRDFWNTPIRIGHIVLALGALAAIALVFLRRGNFPLIVASEAELSVRSWLSSLFVRPRFKELAGHTLAVLGLSEASWPAWIRGGLLTGGVIAQGTILNSFSHYHTPFLISLQRTLIALVIGLVLGLVFSLLARVLVRFTKVWLKSVPDST